MESIIRDFIMEHFFSSGYFSNNQYGFIKGWFTVLQLLKILDDWTNNLDQGKQIDVIYTDFEKAFNKVPHHGLLCKLKEYHLDHRLLHWITDFLCNRKQMVRVNGCYSQRYRVESGILQGSILGPILLILYTSPEADKWRS